MEHQRPFGVVEGHGPLPAPLAEQAAESEIALTMALPLR
jgi:hypothetical protein